MVKNKYIHFSTWAKVIEELNKLNSLVDNIDSARSFLNNKNNNPFYYFTVFIKETREIYTHGAFYGVSDLYIPIEYHELVELGSYSMLIPGAKYRITDYETVVTPDRDEMNIISAGHRFDIIVTATSVNTLSENASCIHNENDDYFTDSNLSAWEIKYTIYNDTDHYVWAKSDGKGVIYYMKDEYDNEAHYDFKNIMFCPGDDHSEWIGTCGAEDLSTDTYFYTFSALLEDDEIYDYSIVGNDGTCLSDTATVIGCYNNKIGYISYGYTHDDGTSPLKIDLPNVIFLESYYYDGSLYYGCYNNTVSGGARNVIVGSNSRNLVVKGDSYEVIIFNGTTDVTVNNSRFITIYPYANNINIGNSCNNITIHESCSSCKVGDYCGNSNIYHSAQYVTIGRSCNGISVGSYDSFVDVGDYCDRVTLRANWRNVKVGNWCVKFVLTAANTSIDNKYLKNVEVDDCINGVSPTSNLRYEIDTMHPDRNPEIMLHIGKSSNGDAVGYNPNDVYPSLINALALADEINGEEV